MIIYFSATGNSKFVSERIAKTTNDIAVSMTDISEKIMLKDGENLGIVSPVYFWGLPSYVNEFLKRINIENAANSYVYFIATYGTTSGQSDYFVKEHLKRKGITLSASFGVKTVDTWTVWFKVNDEAKVKEILTEEEKQIEILEKSVKNREKVFISKDKLPLMLCKPAKIFYNGARKTKHLHVDESCIGCRICETDCHEKAIAMVDGKPQWIKKSCSMCFKCLHNCPEFAIQYDKSTQNNGQYVHPKTTD